jgi:2-polyprenyl-3-methyl-5-hydroxy-6-metoxy-1,4-benzoquinol methylase
MNGFARDLNYEHWQARCAAYFHHDAGHYDGEFLVKLLCNAEIRAFRTLLPDLTKGARVLDFGCGTGRYAFELAKAGLKVDAFDAAPAMRNAVEKKLAASTFELQDNIRIIQAETHLPDAGYAFVCSIGVMDYYPSPDLLLERCARFVAPGGYLAVSFPDCASPLAWLYRMGSAFVFRAFLHSHSSVSLAAGRLGLEFQAMCRSPLNFRLGGMLSFLLFRKPPSSGRNWRIDHFHEEAIPDGVSAPADATEQGHFLPLHKQDAPARSAVSGVTSGVEEEMRKESYE